MTLCQKEKLQCHYNPLQGIYKPNPKEFFPRTSLEGQTTWSKMVKIDRHFVNFFVEYLPVLFSGSGAREQRVCLRMGRVDHKLSRELSEGESDSIPSCGILWSGSVPAIMYKKLTPISSDSKCIAEN